MTNIKINQKFIDTVNGDIWTVTEVTDSSITLKDEYVFSTTYYDHLNDGDFEDWFEANEQ